MPQDTQELVRELNQKISARPVDKRLDTKARGPSPPGVFRLEVEGPQGGVFNLDFRRSSEFGRSGDAADATVRLQTNWATLKALWAGSITPQQAMQSGDLHVEGKYRNALALLRYLPNTGAP